MVSHHNAGQTAGGPWGPRPTMKFHNPWTIRTPGWSCLFVPPLNRPNGVFEVLSGFVDTDTYGVEGFVRVESDDEAEERRRVYRNTLAGEGWYRRESRARR
jgi:hypothetical protein